MPELPEVETVRRGLADVVGSFAISTVEVLRDRAVAAPAGDVDGFCTTLAGCSFASWRRRGKYLISTLLRQGEAAGALGVHLRMTGQFQILGQGERQPCRHTRVRFLEANGQRELRFVDIRSFGEFWLVPRNTPSEAVISGLARLGPEPFDSSFTARYLKNKLRGRTRPIKSALLDQALVAGAGNIYADESLFMAGIRPTIRSGSLSLDQLEQLRQALVEVMSISIGKGGTTFSDFRDLTGTNGNYGGVAKVYRRGGEPCHDCGTPINRIVLSGRATHWCPQCQQ